MDFRDIRGPSKMTRRPFDSAWSALHAQAIAIASREVLGIECAVVATTIADHLKRLRRPVSMPCDLSL